MKLLLLLVPFLLNAWTFQISDIKNYSDKQKEVLRQSYLVGYEKGLELTISTIAIVESRAGKYDFKKNHICGPHQINTDYSDASCEVLEANPYISAMEARNNFLWWYDYSNKDWAKSLKHYNGGFNTDLHGKEYLKRSLIVMKELRKHKQLYLDMIGL